MIESSAKVENHTCPTPALNLKIARDSTIRRRSGRPSRGWRTGRGRRAWRAWRERRGSGRAHAQLRQQLARQLGVAFEGAPPLPRPAGQLSEGAPSSHIVPRTYSYPFSRILFYSSKPSHRLNERTRRNGSSGDGTAPSVLCRCRADQHGISLTNIAVVSRFHINLREACVPVSPDESHG